MLKCNEVYQHSLESPDAKCNEVYQHKSGLSRHIVSCLRSIKFDYEKCNNSFTRKDSLKDHVKICCGKKDLAYSLCPSVFLHSSKLKRQAKSIYIIKEIPEESLEIERTRRRWKIFKTIEGSSIFQAMCFKANQSSFKASPYVYVHHAKMTLVVVRTSRHIVWKSTC